MVLSRSLTILLIEDDDGHAMLVQLNLRQAGINNTIQHVNNGQAALDYINQWQQQSPPTPLVILLDLNLPEIDGYTILEELKSTPRTRAIPVIILTSTDDPREIARCYALGCNIFLRKPVDYVNFTNAIKQLGLFLTVVEVPDIE